VITFRISKLAMVGLTLSATLAGALAGCGGDATKSSDAVVAIDPTVASKSTAAPTASTTPAAGAASPTVASTSTAPVKAEGWGILKGQIVFSGDPPPAKVLQEKGKAAKDPEICAKDAPILSERLVVDPASKGVKNVIVYLPKPTAINEDAKKAAAAANVVFDQKGCTFEPHVLAVMAGVPLTIKSSDPTNHNVNFKLKNTSFNSTVAPGKSLPLTPVGAERTPGAIVCDIHSWMIAWWMVLDHPYFAVTDANGYYEIKDAPAGTQKVVVWQEAAGFVTPPSGEDVTLKANDATIKDFKIDKVRPE
jgi:plastocyanin